MISGKIDTLIHKNYTKEKEKYYDYCYAKTYRRPCP